MRVSCNGKDRPTNLNTGALKAFNGRPNYYFRKLTKSAYMSLTKGDLVPNMHFKLVIASQISQP